jgi:hypothetical protein
MKFYNYVGCPLCTPPSIQVQENYKVECNKCTRNTMYLTDNAINDWLYMPIYDEKDIEQKLKKQMREIVRERAMQFIKSSNSTSSEPITTEMITHYMDATKSSDL